MSIKTIDKEINGNKYTITQFTAFEGIEIKITLGKLFSSSISGIKIKKGQNMLDSDISESDMLVAVHGMFEKLDIRETGPFMLRMLQSGLVRRNNIEITRESFNVDYAGNYLELYKLLGQIIVFNYGEGFFDEGGFGELIKKIQSTKPSLKK